MPQFKFMPIALLVLASGMISTGCQKDTLGIQPVTGKVIYKDAPVEEAMVTFVSKTSEGRGATGVTDKNGIFTLSTPGATKAGAVVGDYDVLILKTIPVDASGNPIPITLPTDSAPTGRPQADVRPRLKSMIPEKYNKSANPQIQASVVKGKNEFQFELVD